MLLSMLHLAAWRRHAACLFLDFAVGVRSGSVPWPRKISGCACCILRLVALALLVSMYVVHLFRRRPVAALCCGKYQRMTYVMCMALSQCTMIDDMIVVLSACLSAWSRVKHAIEKGTQHSVYYVEAPLVGMERPLEP